MGDSPAAIIECLNDQQRGVRIAFSKQDDRFFHTVFGIRGDQSVPLLNSVEGTPEDDEPPSPPYTELHQQGDLLFLSGATTKGHWSMSVQNAEHVILFDVACRMHSEVANLGSTYKTVQAAQTLEAGEFQLIFSADNEEKAYSLVLGPPEAESDDGCCLEQLRSDTGMIQVSARPSGVFFDRYPATVRWKYVFSWALG